MKKARQARTLEITIEKLVAGGDGLGFVDGKAVFVPGVLPLERIRASLLEEHADYDRAELLEVISASPQRQEPPCALAGVCGGCDWLHIRYPEQLEIKRAIVAEALKRMGGIEAGAFEIVAGSPLGYRNRAQVHRDEHGRLGFMGYRTNRVVPVETCPVSVPAVNRVFRGEVPGDMPRFGVFGDGERLAREGAGSGEIQVTVCGRPFVFSVACFFQSNLEMLEKLVPFAVAGLLEDPTRASGEEAEGTRSGGKRRGAAADLYCGVGVFAAHMSRHFDRTIMVESDAVSASYARRNAPGSGHELCARSVEQWIAAGGSDLRLDAAIVDPPRAGLSRAVRDYLAAAAPRRLVYVSCNPVTLARDLKSLLSGGFELRGLKLFDFFPQTSHVESVASLACTR